jgi:hypothetical protein
MYLPAFLLALPLGLAEVRLELVCCRGSTILPLRLLIRDLGDRTFSDQLGRLCCSRCRGWPRRVYLCAEHRESMGGAPADWAIELMTPRR